MCPEVAHSSDIMVPTTSHVGSKRSQSVVIDIMRLKGALLFRVSVLKVVQYLAIDNVVYMVLSSAPSVCGQNMSEPKGIGKQLANTSNIRECL